MKSGTRYLVSPVCHAGVSETAAWWATLQAATKLQGIRLILSTYAAEV